MFPSAPTAAGLTVVLGVALLSTIGFSLVWAIFALTLAVTTAVAIHRSIPRKER